MKKSVICICPDEKPIEEVFNALRAKFAISISTELNVFGEQFQIALKSNTEKPEAYVFQKSDPNQINKNSLEEIVFPLIDAYYNRSGCTVKNIYTITNTYIKPLLTLEQQENNLIYKIPKNINATAAKYYAKIIWLDLNRARIPALSFCSVEGEKLSDYYDNRKAYYKKRIEQILKNQR